MKQRFLVQDVPRGPKGGASLYALIGGTYYFLWRKSWSEEDRRVTMEQLFDDTCPKLSKKGMELVLHAQSRIHKRKIRKPYILEYEA